MDNFIDEYDEDMEFFDGEGYFDEYTDEEIEFFELSDALSRMTAPRVGGIW